LAHGICSPENQGLPTAPDNLQSIWIADFNAFWIINVKIKCIPMRLAVCLMLAGLLSACSQSEFVDAEGNDIDWQDYKGQWLVVNFWAEWCAPCLEEIPELNRLHSKAGQRVLGVNFDHPELAELQRQINTLAVKFPVVYTEQGQRLQKLMPQVLPTSYVFDQRGILQHTLVGPQTLASIEALMASDKQEKN